MADLVLKWAFSELTKKAIDDEKRTVSGFASTPMVDRDGESVDPESFREFLPRYRKNPVVLFNHQSWEPPIGKNLEIDVKSEGLWVVDWFSKTAKGELIYTLVKEGVLNAFSPGYIQHNRVEGEKNVIVREILEHSIVTLPAGPEALVQDVKSLTPFWTLHTPISWASNSTGIYIWPLEAKGATQFADLPLADEDRAWDASASEARVRRWAGISEPADLESASVQAKYKKRFFWFDPETKDSFAGYKLPFADVIDGTLKAVPRGVFAAAGVLMGARGGVDIPEGDVSGVKAHVARYYAKMDREPPWEKESALRSRRTVRKILEALGYETLSTIAPELRKTFGDDRATLDDIDAVLDAKRAVYKELSDALSRQAADLRRIVADSLDALGKR